MASFRDLRGRRMAVLLSLLALSSSSLPSALAAPRFDMDPPGLTPNAGLAKRPGQFLPTEATFKPRPGQKPHGKVFSNYKKENWTAFAEHDSAPAHLVPNAPRNGLRSIGYFPGWSYADVPLPTEVTSRLTHVVYAFSTIAWSNGRWYLDFVNRVPETETCPVGGNCWDPYNSDQCITVPTSQTCDGSRISIVPRFGANTCVPEGQCWNKQDMWKSPQCTTTVRNGICGQMGYLMKKVKRDPANRNLRLLLGIGGASDSNYWTMATERWSIGSLVKNIVDTSISLGFDGVDIDWEYPTFERGGQPLPNAQPRFAYGEGRDCLNQPCQYGRRRLDGAKYVDLMRRLRAAFNRRGRNRFREPYVLTAALPATGYYADRFDAGAICAASDFVNIMSYDYFGDWSSKTGPNAGLYYAPDMTSSVHGSMQMYENRGCPRSKMNLGIPFYGHVFNNVRPGPLRSGMGMPFTRSGYDVSRKYTDLVAMVNTEPGWTIHYDNATWSRSQTAVAYNRAQRKFATFETPYSIEQKRKYALETGVGGLMYWSLGLDDANNNLLKAAIPSVRR